MTLKRFKKIFQYLHLNDEEQRPEPQDKNYDILYKARPALDIISRFQEYHLPSHDPAVDEAMTGFKGGFHLKQYMPRKPTKWGIKAWGLADSTNGYLLRCQIYRGRKETKDRDLLLGEQVVLQMTEEYVEKWHHVYFDNFFTSTKLVKLLFGKEALCLWNSLAKRLA
jgi:hypothetical protein